AACGIVDCPQKVRQIGVGTIVVRGEFHGASEFLEGATGVTHFEIGLTKVVVRLGETGVDLNGVQILDRRLTVFALRGISFAAVQIFLLPHVGIARTSGKHYGEKTTSRQQTKGNRMSHIAFSNGGSGRTKASIRTALPTAPDNTAR